MEHDLIKIYNEFGFDTQLNQLIEENHETNSALKHYKIAFWMDAETKDLFLNYLDELGDQLNVALGIARVKYGITLDDANAMRLYKISRTIRIINIMRETGETYEQVRERVR